MATVRELITLLGFKLDDSGAKKYDKQVDASKKKTESLTAAFVKAQMIYGAAMKVASGVFGFIQNNIIGATIEMEGYRTQMEAFTGSADDAAEALASLRDKTIDPLFGTGNLVNAYKQLRTVGMDAENTSRMIDVLGDVANGSVENFNALGNVLTRVATTGKVNEGTLRQLASAGYGVGDMAQGLGMSVDQLNAQIKAGKIGFNELTRAMEGSTREGGRFYGNAERQARTLSGSIKILQDTIGSMGDAIGTAVLPKIVDVITHITRLIKLGRDGFVNFGVKAFEGLLYAIGRAIGWFFIFKHKLKDLGVSFEPIKRIAADVFSFLGSVIESAMPFIMNVAAAVIAAFEPIEAFVKPVLESLKNIFVSVFGLAGDSTEGLAKGIKGLTPLFEMLGRVVGGLTPWIAGAFFGTKGLIGAFNIGRSAVDNYRKAMNLVTGVQGLFSGNLTQVGMAFRSFGLPQEKINQITEAFMTWKGRLIDFKTSALDTLRNVGGRLADFGGKIADVTRALLANAAAALKAAGAWIKNTAQVIANKIATAALAVAQRTAAAATAAWDWMKMAAGVVKSTAVLVANKIATIAVSAAQKIAAATTQIWAGIQAVFNAIMAANPIALIIIGVIALIAAVVLLVKNWDKVGPAIMNAFSAIGGFFKMIGSAIAGFFKMIWDTVVGVFKKIAAFVKDNLVNIINVVVTILFPIAGIVMALVRLIIKNWDKIKPALTKIFTAVVDKLKAVWGKITGFVRSVADGIRNVWDGLVNVLAGIWERIKNAAAAVWDGITDVVRGVIDGIKNIWNGLTDFFTGLWDALKESPAAALEYILNAFTGVFDNIKRIFFGLIDKVKEGWESVKGFFGGVVNGVVNFVTGGGGEPEARPVNDLIVTPEGRYSTHPDDYVMAMKNPGDLVDAILRFIGGPQPAYAGGGSLVGNTMSRAASQTNYNSSSSNVTSVSAPINVRVDASGMPPDMAAAVVRRGVEDALREAINGTRGSITSPEARRR